MSIYSVTMVEDENFQEVEVETFKNLEDAQNYIQEIRDDYIEDPYVEREPQEPDVVFRIDNTSKKDPKVLELIRKFRPDYPANHPKPIRIRKKK